MKSKRQPTMHYSDRQLCQSIHRVLANLLFRDDAPLDPQAKVRDALRQYSLLLFDADQERGDSARTQRFFACQDVLEEVVRRIKADSALREDPEVMQKVACIQLGTALLTQHQYCSRPACRLARGGRPSLNDLSERKRRVVLRDAYSEDGPWL